MVFVCKGCRYKFEDSDNHDGYCMACKNKNAKYLKRNLKRKLGKHRDEDVFDLEKRVEDHVLYNKRYRELIESNNKIINESNWEINYRDNFFGNIIVNGVENVIEVGIEGHPAGCKCDNCGYVRASDAYIEEEIELDKPMLDAMLKRMVDAGVFTNSEGENKHEGME